MVVEDLLTGDELLAVDRRLEEAAVLVVEEELERAERKPVRLFEPAKLAGATWSSRSPLATSA